MAFYHGFAQKNHWDVVGQDEIRNNENIKDYDISLKKASFFRLEKQKLKLALENAPFRNTFNSNPANIVIPSQNGEFEIYQIFKSNTLSPALAARYPEIKSYVGSRADEHDGSIIRITSTPIGIYIMVLKSVQGQLFINPVDNTGEYYMSFLKTDATDHTKQNCFFENSSNSNTHKSFENQVFSISDSTLRTYRLAVAVTGEYSEYHINQAGLSNASISEKISAVLSAIMVTIDRVNAIYERDLGITLQLVDDNDQVIFLNPASDPYTNNNVNILLIQNQSTLDNIIAPDNYDIGHVFCTSGSGVAVLESLCQNGIKAQGVSGSTAPAGDPFDVDYVSHEIGHQFGANHTFNNFCFGARHNPTAVEPGSGNTIMAYAGVCSPNVQFNSDAHFHNVSLNEIYQYITLDIGSSCAILTNQNNTPPSLSALPNYVIPKGTAFALDVNASDAENDALTYNWEQIDNGIPFQNNQEQPPVSSSVTGPNFKSLPSSQTSERFFPSFNNVLNGNLSPLWEVVPSVSRSLNFSVTVRDNNVNVGNIAQEFVNVNVADAGPFEITSQNSSGINWLTGETRNITWNVAGTTANGIDTDFVNILLSTDGGLNFDTVLSENTANDGEESIIVPDIQAETCRILIEPVDNIYFAVNLVPFSINSKNSEICDGFDNLNAVSIPDGEGTFENPVEGLSISSTINIPNNVTNISEINVTLNVTHSYINDLEFELQAPNGDSILLWSRNCGSENDFIITFNDNASALPAPGDDCTGLTNGTFAPFSNETDLLSLFSNGTAGDWTLSFSDFFPQDTGMLNSWEIEICTTNFSVDDSRFNEFSIVPNPNQGIFDINLNQPIGDDSVISIYDIRGRLIESLKPNTNSSTINVQLKNQYQNGTYIIEIANSNGKIVRKLILK